MGLKERLATEKSEQLGRRGPETKRPRWRRVRRRRRGSRIGRGRLGEFTLAVDRHQGKAGYDKQQIAARRRDARARSCGAGWDPWPRASRRGEAEEASLRGELLAAEEEAKAAETALLESMPARPMPRPDQEQARDAQVG